ncbi:MAG: NUDIX domain-containing protein [Dehalococcoidia bacterium]|nr:NUDIX domain-containing protein [Dehalococcoidia bacterium]
MALPEPPRFCPRCGRPFAATEAPARCTDAACGYVWYRDPKVGVGVVLADAAGRILLVRRNHQPRLGLWAFPSGFVDAGEVVEAAALREVREETGVAARLDGLLGVYSAPGEQVIFVAYAGTIVGGEPRAGDEAIEVGLFAPDALPPLAFDHDDQIIERWRALRAGDRPRGA